MKKIIVLIVNFLLLATAASAFSTNASDKVFTFTVTSGASNEPSSSNFKSTIIVGDITGSINSSNFRSDLGFNRITGYVSGEACSIAAECVGGYCCSSLCQSNACPTSTSSSSTTTSSGGGGGGGVASSTGINYQNIYSRFITEIKSGKELSFTVNRGEIAITNIKFTTNEDLSKVDIDIRVEANPKFTIENVIQYLNIVSIKLAKVTPKEFIIEFKISKNSVSSKEAASLYRYKDGWQKLSTKFLKEEGNNYFYESNSPGFSLFAIAGDKKTVEPETQTPTEIVNNQTPEVKEEVPVQEEKEKIKEEKEKKKEFNTSLIMGILLGLLLMGGGGFYMYQKKVSQPLVETAPDEDFYDIVSKADSFIGQNNIQEATKEYFRLVHLYTELSKTTTDREELIDMYLGLQHVYNKLLEIRNAKKAS